MIHFTKSAGKAYSTTFFDHDGMEHAGYLAFMGLLSFFPFLLFLVGIAGMVGELEGSRQFIQELHALLPDRISHTLAPRISEILSAPPDGLFTIAVIGMIWTASAIIEACRGVLNRAYHVQDAPHYIWRRLLSIAQFLLITVLLLIGTSALLLLPVGIHALEAHMGIEHLVAPYWHYARLAFSAALIFFAIAGSYYYLPNIKVRFRSVIPGALIVLGLWMGAAELFVWYLSGSNQINIVYGSLGGIIATLLFFFIMAAIYIFGAEFNYIYGRKPKGRR